MIAYTLPIGTGLQGRNGRYLIDKHLATGGFGNTYLAHRVSDNYRVAIKEFFISDINYRREGSTVVHTHVGKEALFQAQMRKFRDEAAKVSIMRNSHIVRLYDYFEGNATAYFVMEFVDGHTLSELLKARQAPFSEAEASNYFLQVLDALNEVHSKRVWHLDIKPGNIMLTQNREAKLIDFGASKQMDVMGNMTTTGPAYTPGYAPLEQVNAETSKFGPWTDFYALGATFYNLVTNKKAPTSSDIIERKEAAFLFPTGTSVRMKNVIYWLMRPDINERPRSVYHILQYWNSYNQAQQPSARVASRRQVASTATTTSQPARKSIFGRMSDMFDDLMDVLD